MAMRSGMQRRHRDVGIETNAHLFFGVIWRTASTKWEGQRSGFSLLTRGSMWWETIFNTAYIIKSHNTGSHQCTSELNTKKSINDSSSAIRFLYDVAILAWWYLWLCGARCDLARFNIRIWCVRVLHRRRCADCDSTPAGVSGKRAPVASRALILRHCVIEARRRACRVTVGASAASTAFGMRRFHRAPQSATSGRTRTFFLVPRTNALTLWWRLLASCLSRPLSFFSLLFYYFFFEEKNRRDVPLFLSSCHQKWKLIQRVVVETDLYFSRMWSDSIQFFLVAWWWSFATWCGGWFCLWCVKKMFFLESFTELFLCFISTLLCGRLWWRHLAGSSCRFEGKIV